MQKFTRALTREVEVEGERLAVTLDASGLSLRPVGSRRAPLTLSWEAVVCACTGKLPAGEAASPQELAAALKVFRSAPTGAATPAKQGASAAAGEEKLADLLARLDTWLKQQRKRYHEGLNSGASAEALA